MNFDDPVFLRFINDPGGVETLYRDYLKLETLLSSELSTLLAGRNLQFEVFPFDFREVLR